MISTLRSPDAGVMRYFAMSRRASFRNPNDTIDICAICSTVLSEAQVQKMVTVGQVE